MPDLWSCGLGGGSRLHFSEDIGNSDRSIDNLSCKVGPDSVGSKLLEEAVCAGGRTLTATGAAVVLGTMVVGDAQRAQQHMTRQQAQQAWHSMQRTLADAVDRMKAAPTAVPVVVVGGGAPLCDESLPGASYVLIPEHAGVANAVGAAILQVGSVVDRCIDLGPDSATRAAALQRVEEQAMQEVVNFRAARGECEIVMREVLPLAYQPGATARVIVRAVGPVDLNSKLQRLDDSVARQASEVAAEDKESAGSLATPRSDASAAQSLPIFGRGEEPSVAELAAWTPKLGAGGAWVLSPEDIHLLAIGTGILGCGGGGSPSRAKLKALLELQK